MKCQGCDGEVVQDSWGDWCDDCGGVAAAPRDKEGKVRLLYRHVATADGKAGRFAVVYDESTANYGTMWPRENATVKCVHCGQQTPADLRNALLRLDDMQPTGYYSRRGSLDAMLAIALSVARGNSEDLPTLYVGTAATPQERELVLGV